MAKKIAYRGKELEELEKMSLDELAVLMTARERRKIKRGFAKNEKKLLDKIRQFRGKDKLIRTKSRDMVVLPEMVGSKIGIYDGKEFKMVIIDARMIGHRLGEFSLTRKTVKHSSPGLGATRSSKSVPLK